MKNVTIHYLVSFMTVFSMICSYTSSQEIEIVKSVVFEKDIRQISNFNETMDITIIKQDNILTEPSFENVLFENQVKHNKPGITNNFGQADLISSFRNNIRFGGFWDKYTIINITPQLNIKPYDFLSIYAYRSSSYFVPVAGIKQNIKSMVFRGCSVLLTDNVVKLLWSSNTFVAPIINFLAKNILINFVNKSFEGTDNKNDLRNYDYQYYSVSIKF